MTIELPKYVSKGTYHNLPIGNLFSPPNKYINAGSTAATTIETKEPMLKRGGRTNINSSPG